MSLKISKKVYFADKNKVLMFLFDAGCEILSFCRSNKLNGESLVEGPFGKLYTTKNIHEKCQKAHK